MELSLERDEWQQTSEGDAQHDLGIHGCSSEGDAGAAVLGADSICRGDGLSQAGRAQKSLGSNLGTPPGGRWAEEERS